MQNRSGIQYKVDKLRIARERRGWDLTAMAYKCGVSYSTISLTERGLRQSPDLIRKMAKILRVPLRSIEILPEEKVA